MQDWTEHQDADLIRRALAQPYAEWEPDPEVIEELELSEEEILLVDEWILTTEHALIDDLLDQDFTVEDAIRLIKQRAKVQQQGSERYEQPRMAFGKWLVEQGKVSDHPTMTRIF